MTHFNPFNPYGTHGIIHSSFIYKSEPIDNHHSTNEKRRVYPNLGRKLTPEDVGKLIIRTYPRKCENYYDWSSIPYDSTKKNAEDAASVVASLENGVVKLADSYSLPNDSHWLTLEEWLAIPDKDAQELANKTLREAQMHSEQKSADKKLLEDGDKIKNLWESFKSRRPKSTVDKLKSLPIHESAPIDNHHPKSKEMRVYPNLGRELTLNDIGKKVVRAFPRKFEDDGSCDWSVVPHNSTKEAAEDAASVVVSFTNSLSCGVELSGSYFLPNDSHWLTLEEWLAIPDKDAKEMENRTARSAKKPFEKEFPNFKEKIDSVKFSNFKEKIDSVRWLSDKKTADSAKRLNEKINAILTQKPSHDSNISDKKDSKVCQEWIQQKKKTLADKLLPSDYSYYGPRRPTQPAFKPGKLNLTATSPREVLGFPPDFDDLEAITKRYRKLALKFHPDKNNDHQAEKFKKIKAAYDAIKLEIEGDFFVCGDMQKFEEVFTRAAYHYELLRTSRNPNEPVAATVNRWKLFCRELLIMDLNECDEKVILFQFQRLQRKADSHLMFWELKSEMENIRFPEHCEVDEKSVNDLLDRLKKLQELVDRFDLNNRKGPVDCTWTDETIEVCFEKSNLFVIDKYVALARSAAEIALKMDQTERALEIRKDANDFVLDRNFNILSGKKIAKDEFDSKQIMNYSLFNARKENKETSQEEKRESQHTTSETKLKDEPSQKLEPIQEYPDESHTFSETKELKKNIENNQQFFLLSKAGIPALLRENTSQVSSKWYVPLKRGACLYKQNTNDFGVRIKEMLISSEISETSTNFVAQEASKGKFTLFHQMRNLKETLEKLGIKYKETEYPYPVRDYFLKLHTGETRVQNLSDLNLASQRAASGAFYFNKGGLTRTENPFFKATTGVANAHAALSSKEMKDFGSVYLKQHFEGGNVFTVTNNQRKTQIFIGSDHKYTNYLFHRSDKKLFELFKSEETPLKERLSKALSKEKIYKVAEKMYAHGILKVNGETGYMDFEKINNVFSNQQEKINTINDEGENHFYRKKAVAMGLLKPFPTEISWTENYRASVSNFLFQKYVVNKAQALELNVGPEDIHFLPQAMYHLDTFLKPGPKGSMFVANFAMNCDLIKALLAEAEAEERELSQEDQKLLNRYLTSSQRLHQELSPLLDTVGEKIKKAGLTLIPMPGVFFDEPLTNEKTFNFNVMNAISGWSEKTERYFYITSGIKVGDKLGNIFMDLITKFLKSYQSDIDVFFVGSPKENPEDFSEPMNAWNRINFQAGIHCFTFETSTAPHVQIH